MKLIYILIILLSSLFFIYISVSECEKRYYLSSELNKLCNSVSEKCERKMMSVKGVCRDFYSDVKREDCDIDKYITDRFSPLPESKFITDKLSLLDKLPFDEKTAQIKQLIVNSSEILRENGDKRKETLITSLCFYPGLALVLMLVII